MKLMLKWQVFLLALFCGLTVLPLVFLLRGIQDAAGWAEDVICPFFEHPAGVLCDLYTELD